MKLKDQLTEKKQALLDLEPALKAEDVSEETITQGEELAKEIGELEQKIATAEKAAKVLETIGTAESKNNDDMEDKKMSQIDEFTAKCAEITDKKTGVSMHFEKAYNSVVTSPTIAEVDRSIAPQPSRRAVADNFIVANVSGNAVTYFLQGAFET